MNIEALQADKIEIVVSNVAADFEAAADLIDKRDDNAHPLDRNLFYGAHTLVVARYHQQVIGCAVIKSISGLPQGVGECGFLVVSPQYRRIGIARRLTQKRLEVARQQGLHFLFATVRDENHASRANLLHSGWQFWGNYLSVRGTGNTIGWYYYSLDTTINAHAVMTGLVGDRVLVNRS